MAREDTVDLNSTNGRTANRQVVGQQQRSIERTFAWIAQGDLEVTGTATYAGGLARPGFGNNQRVTAADRRASFLG